MKKHINGFLFLSVLSLLVVPAINTYNASRAGKGGIDTSNKDMVRWFDFIHFYNVEFALPSISNVLYKMGGSLYPKEVVIGNDGWLFLGDQYEKTISEKRNLTPDKKPLIDKMSDARKSWDQYVKSYGGIGYFFSYAPNKHSVYGNYAPKWFTESHGSRNSNYLLGSSINDATFINMGSSFENIKMNEQLFYKTDTHWNRYGAWFGYKEIASVVGKRAPSIKWLSDADVKFKKVERAGGDLSNFLRLQNALKDLEYVSLIPGADSVRIYRWDGTYQATRPIDRSTIILKVPQETRNNKALNDLKVLWLRDSFGTALEHYMNATFSNVRQAHFSTIMPDPKLMTKTIAEYKPDIVIITAVERQAFIPMLSNFPVK